MNIKSEPEPVFENYSNSHPMIGISMNYEADREMKGQVEKCSISRSDTFNIKLEPINDDQSKHSEIHVSVKSEPGIDDQSELCTANKVFIKLESNMDTDNHSELQETVSIELEPFIESQSNAVNIKLEPIMDIKNELNTFDQRYMENQSKINRISSFVKTFQESHSIKSEDDQEEDLELTITDHGIFNWETQTTVKEEAVNIKEEEGGSKRKLISKKETAQLNCAEGNNSFLIQEDLSDQVKGPYKCNICDKVFDLKSARKEHMVSHRRSAICKICNVPVTFNRLSDLEAHLKTHEEELLCQLCNQLYKSKSRFEKHMALHNLDREYVCEVCNISFSLKKALYYHKNKVHPEKKMQHACDTCDKSFHFKKAYEEHIKLHAGAYACETCSKTFSQKARLELHMKTHEEKDYKCDMCNERFHIKRLFVKHVASHKASNTRSKRPFACDKCNKSFSDSKQLRHHQKTVSHRKKYGNEVVETKPLNLPSVIIPIVQIPVGISLLPFQTQGNQVLPTVVQNGDRQ